MPIGPEAISLRLTANQVTLIWAGLSQVVNSYSVWRNKKEPLYSYSFRLNPPPLGFNQGAYESKSMNAVLSVWKRMRSKTTRGGRFQMGSIEIRAAIFGVRVNSDWERFRRQARLRLEGLKSSSVDIGASPEVQLKKRTAQTISTLERHLKRANYRLLSFVPRGDYDNLTKRWRAHVRWMRLHLAYFPARRPPILAGRKGARQLILNDLITIAERAIVREGYVVPDAAALRKVVRQFLAYSRRGRLPYPLTYMLNKDCLQGASNVIFDFVDQKLNLVEWKQ